MIAAVVLAAGAATRFGAAKQQLLLPYVLRRVSEAGIETTVVVLGAYEFPVEGVRSSPARIGTTARARRSAQGSGRFPPKPTRRSSVSRTARSSRPRRFAAWLAAWESGTGDVVAAAYGGVRGHPVCIGRAAWSDIPNAGGRELEAVLVPCDDLGEPADVDTPEDLRRIEPLLAE